jgi:hypothetical protein
LKHEVVFHTLMRIITSCFNSLFDNLIVENNNESNFLT